MDECPTCELNRTTKIQGFFINKVSIAYNYKFFCQSHSTCDCPLHENQEWKGSDEKNIHVRKTYMYVKHTKYMRWVFMTGIHCYQPVLSIALERIKEPSGLSRRPVTVSVCPDILYNTSFFLRSHTWEHIQMINKIKNMWMKCDHYCNLKLVIRHLKDVYTTLLYVHTDLAYRSYMSWFILNFSTSLFAIHVNLKLLHPSGSILVHFYFLVLYYLSCVILSSVHELPFSGFLQFKVSLYAVARITQNTATELLESWTTECTSNFLLQ